MLNEHIKVDGGEMPGYLVGASDGSRPGLLLIQEIFGINNAMRLAADGFARDGFIVLAPDVYHRISKGIELGYSDKERDQAIGLWGRLDDGRAQKDIAAAIDHLRAHPGCDGRVAAVGFCLGGKYVLLAAAQGQLDAAVSFYPVKVKEYRAELNRLGCPVQVHLGDADQHTPPDIQEILRDSLASSDRNDFQLHVGAGHGFYNSIRSFGYHPQAAADAHAATLRFINRSLGPSV